MKTVILCYHKNITLIYPTHWIDQYRESILGQTYKDYEIYECCYNAGRDRIFKNSNYESKEFPSFIHAMNHLINKALYFGADALANTNVDDVFFDRWLEIQLPFIEKGADIVSCNFTLVKDDIAFHEHHFDKLNIKDELNKNHNPIAHPAVCYSKKFLENNRYTPEWFPVEDMKLWQATIDNYKFKIVSENLLYHRIHSNSVCQSQNR